MKHFLERYFPTYSRLRNNQKGFTLAIIIVVTVLLSALALAVANIAISNVRFTGHEQKSASALNVAEAGVNYYLWHLSHNTIDYCDGASTCTGSGPFGPYVHSYYDASGKLLGTYTLTITPPGAGSTVTTVQSVGQVTGLSGNRTILAQLGIPSFASYALLTNSEVWFGSTESSVGPVHSNVGVHFDGVNNGPVTSANANYVPSVGYGGNGSTSHTGVWGAGGPASQWQYPVPTVNFNQVTANLAALKTLAQSNGVYLAPLNTPAQASKGYYLLLKNNGTVDIYTVTEKTTSLSGVTDKTNAFSVKTFVRNQAAPANGVMYVEDNVWVEGAYNGRLTIATGRLPDPVSTRTSIHIVDGITYTATDGSVAVGLIAQKDALISYYAPSTMTLYAALLAQNGFAGFDIPGASGCNFSGALPARVKTSLTFVGAIASNGSWTWSYSSGASTCSGYNTNSSIFDTFLKYAPPPQFPITGTYSILNWRELLYNP
jgi:type II secretory pathway pseudopilin PulG